MKAIVLVSLVVMAGLTGCANQDHVGVQRLGSHVAQIRSEQTFNPNATQENLGLVPDGNGERMEDVYSIYTGKKVEVLQGSNSQVIKGFQ